MLYWERPYHTIVVLTMTILIIYKEWVGKAMSASLIWLVAKMVQERGNRMREKYDEVITVSTASDQSMTESIVSAQYGLISLHQIMQQTNVAIMKMRSIYTAKAYKHASLVMAAIVGLAIFLAVLPLKYVIMSGILYCFVMTSAVGKYMSNYHSNRRMKEWWDSIPIVPVRVVDGRVG
ncbi:PREDICTED: uncharacterized protein LOC104804881 [Tarenaya hassleriana]|uniref:uncharacterized protein LOC104804881 n=1 Tax=Tarenaya hassleriana TaxID=28532 RepID=UPI00053C343C|nr:PREDICTED: uncharacterized protein LOC104804881 [Tarenaya hassleriana]